MDNINSIIEELADTQQLLKDKEVEIEALKDENDIKDKRINELEEFISRVESDCANI